MVAKRFKEESGSPRIKNIDIKNFETIRFSCLSKKQDVNFADYFESLYGRKFETLLRGDELVHPVLVIIDEVQRCYAEIDSILWDAIKISPVNLYIVCLGVYGHEQASSPCLFDATFDLELLKFTSKEFEAFFTMYFANNLGFGEHQELRDFINSITDRHPGLLKSIFKYMSEFKRWDSNLSVEDVFVEVRSKNFIQYLSTQARYSFSIFLEIIQIIKIITTAAIAL